MLELFESGEDVLKALLVVGLFGAFASLIGAVILKLAARWAFKLDVPFRTAFITMVLCTAATVAAELTIALIIGLVAAPDSSVADWAAQLVSLALGVVIQGAIIGSRLEIGFRKGLILSLIMFGVGIALAIVFGLLAFAIITAAGGSVSVSL